MLPSWAVSHVLDKKNMETNSKQIDRKFALEVANTILRSLDGLPFRLYLSALSGLAIATVLLTKKIAECTTQSEEDGLEKLILSWLSSTDPGTGLKFSRYISTQCLDDINIDDLLKDNGNDSRI